MQHESRTAEVDRFPIEGGNSFIAVVGVNRTGGEIGE